LELSVAKLIAGKGNAVIYILIWNLERQKLEVRSDILATSIWDTVGISIINE